MDHADHVWLIRRGVEWAGNVWADLGAGSGAFTLALAEVVGPGAHIYAVDRDAGALRANDAAMRARFPNVKSSFQVADFTGPLAVPLLDGAVMANSLHFQEDQLAALRHVRELLGPGGRLVVVEYSISRGNFAVPYPVPFERWQRLAGAAGFEHTELLERRPSRWWTEMYSAVSW
jgi:ubiquinone/menaquinone biosynthesis C-methylase UbiE